MDSVLQWLWVSCHGPQASLIFPYLIPMLPDIFGMSELNDSPELQTYSSAVLYVLSAITPAPEFVGDILQNFVKAIKSSKVTNIAMILLRFILTSADTVMADPSQRRTGACGVLLPQFDGHKTGRSIDGYGRLPRLFVG